MYIAGSEETVDEVPSPSPATADEEHSAGSSDEDEDGIGAGSTIERQSRGDDELAILDGDDNLAEDETALP